MPGSLGQLLADPDFQALAPDRQAALRREFFETTIARDPDYMALDEAGRNRIRQETLGAEAEPGLARGFLGATGERFMQGAKTLGTPGTGAFGTAGALLDMAFPLGGGLNYLGQELVRRNAPPDLPGAMSTSVPDLGGLGMLPRALAPTTEQAASVVGGIAEIAGGVVPGYTLAARGARKAIEGARKVPGIVDLTVPRTEIPRAEPRVPGDVADLLHPEPYPRAETVRQGPFGDVERFPGARPQVPHPIVPISQAESNARTLDAAHQQAVGSSLARPLDLGEVGRRRAQQHIESDLKAYWGDTLRIDADNAHRAGDSVGLPPSRRMGVPDGEVAFAADPPPIGSPSTFAVWVGKTKEAIGSKGGRFFGFPFRELVKDIPGLRKMNAAVERSVDIGHEIKHGLFGKVNDIYATISRNQDSIARVNSVLDGQAPMTSLSMAEQGVALEMRALFNQLDPGAGSGPVRDYFKRIRDKSWDSEAAIKETREIVIEAGRGYIPVQIEAYLSKQFRPHFENLRTMPGIPATELGMGPIYTYMQAYARKILLNGGVDPISGRQVAGLLDTMREGVRHTPDDNAWRGIVLSWVNDTLGVPRGTFSPRTEQLVRAGKGYQFARTLGGNPLAPLVNATGAFNTFAMARSDRAIAAAFDMADPMVREQALSRGIVSQFSEVDREAFARLSDPRLREGFAGKAEQVSDAILRRGALGKPLGEWFRRSENAVRLHAFATGLREAAARGLVGDAAGDYAHDFVTKTQFRYSREALPSGFRKPGIGQLITQYKTFPINQALVLKNLAVEDIRDTTELLRGNVPWNQVVDRLPTRSAKAWGLIIGLFGSDAAMAGFDKSLNWQLTGKDEHLFKGVLPMLGVHIANQVGLSVIPVEDFRMLYWYLPGPMASMLADTASLATILNPVDPTAPFGRNLSFDRGIEGFGKPMSAEQFASKTARLPPGGIILNRFRQAVVEARAARDNQPLRAPLTLPEAFGVAPRGPGNPVVRGNTGPGNALKALIGVQDPATALRFEARAEQADDIARRQEIVAEAVRLRTLGQDREADEFLERARKQYGLDIRVGREAMRGAVRRSAQEPTERIRRLPRDLRGRAQRRLEAIEAEEGD